MKEPKTLSASRYSLFKECQLKYHAVYDLGMKGETHPSAKIGSVFHAAMEQAVKDGVIPDKEFIRASCVKFQIPESSQESAITEVTELAEKTVKNGYLDGIGNCIGTEYSFDVKLSDDKTVISGFIDRLDKIDNRYSIIDLKTGWVPYTVSELDNNAQAKIYDLAIRKQFPDVDQVELIFWFVKSQKRIFKTFDIDRSVKHEAELIAARAEIISITEPKPTINKYCEYCPFATKCPAYSEKKPVASFFDIAKSF